MSTAVANWKKWLGIGAAGLAFFGGCKDSEFSNRNEGVQVAQFYGPDSQPHTATIRWQMADSQLLNSVCAHTSLRELSIFTATRDGSPILPFIAKLKNLQSLNIVEVPLNDDELRALGEATQLTSLELSRTGIDGCGLQFLTRLPLKRLVIRDRQLSIEGLRALASMTELEELELCIPGIHLADLPTLASNKNLKSVTITDGHFSYREFGGLKFLIGANSLRDLHLSGVNLNDRTLKSISSLSNLRKLTIDECVISEEGIEHLALLANLQSVDVPAVQRLQNDIRLAESVADEPLPQPIRS